MARTERYETIILGAGQAGLSAGHWLARHDHDVLIVDTDARVSDLWCHGGHLLQLFIPAKDTTLSGVPFAGDPHHLPERRDVAADVEWYEQENELPVRTGVRISSVRLRDGIFEIATDGVQLQAENVIVATAL